MKRENPLYNDTFHTAFETIPFEDIRPGDFKPAIEKFIKKTQKKINAIIENSVPPDFFNTIEALEFSGLELDRIAKLLSNLNAAETGKDLHRIVDEMMPMLTKFGNDIRLNEGLFNKIKKVYDSVSPGQLTTEQYRLLEKTYKNFVRNGALLDPKQKQRLREIDQELTKLKLVFSKNVLKETNAFHLHIKKEKDLAGLPEQVIEEAKKIADSMDKEGWVFTLQAPSYIPFVKYAKNRKLRKIMTLVYGSRAFKPNENDNRENVLNIARLRKERARLLGYETHADFVLEERMAQTPGKVIDFLNKLYDVAYPVAKKELKKLEQLAKQDGIERLEKWDVAYYMEKLKQKELDLEEEKLRPYFELESVKKGIFEIVRRLYGLHFEEQKNIQKYHKDVQVYRVTDDKGKYVALLYLDFYPRKGKRPGAWMTSYKSQWKKDGVNSRPHISIVTNFSKPGIDSPALLSFNEVTTFFHEFGHALHGMLADTTYPSLSGTNVYWDFVELPSQIMENWAYEKEALELFAKHYKTGEQIPAEMIDKIKKSMQFMEGFATNRQLSFGFLDMDWHYSFDPQKVKDVGEFEKRSLGKTELLPHYPKNNMSVAFSHIFPGGYSAGYYSYKWAEVLDADAFSLFKEKGIFDKETAEGFKELMQKGGTEHPMELYKKFRGREPDIAALLKRAGLKK